ncbi:MAG: hypothetical protein J0H63_14690, partial [Rhizobiales bacterium]|nr:hypothetical protein [Hyphomicrobiales bacterium]
MIAGLKVDNLGTATERAGARPAAGLAPFEAPAALEAEGLRAFDDEFRHLANVAAAVVVNPERGAAARRIEDKGEAGKRRALLVKTIAVGLKEFDRATRVFRRADVEHA